MNRLHSPKLNLSRLLGVPIIFGLFLLVGQIVKPHSLSWIQLSGIGGVAIVLVAVADLAYGWRKCSSRDEKFTFIRGWVFGLVVASALLLVVIMIARFACSC